MVAPTATQQSCSQFIGSQPLYPTPVWSALTGHNLAPWVQIWFINGDFCVAVGNNSMPGGSSPSPIACGIGSTERTSCDGQITTTYAANHAVITSFSYGHSGGNGNGSDGLAVEIIDEEGSEFCNFMINLFPKGQAPGDAATSCDMAFQFGWISLDCSGNPCNVLSRPRKVTPQTVDVSFTGGGVIKFVINAVNPATIIAEGTNNDNTIYSSNLTLKEAIVKMFQDQCKITPLFLTSVSQATTGTSVCYENFLATCSNQVAFDDAKSYPEWEFFNNEGLNGKPSGEAGWDTNNKDPINAALSWLQEKATNNDPPRGFVVGTCNLANSDPTVIFWESPLPDCQGNAPQMDNIGTYIVNGGACSSVLSFTPKMNWTRSNTGKGGSVGDYGTQASLALKNCKTTGKGTAERVIITSRTATQSGINGGDHTVVAHSAQTRATPVTPAISADLVVQGNPYLDNPVSLCKGMKCSILVVNPFMLRPNVTLAQCATGCCDGGTPPNWLADPPVNTMLSNRGWIIEGVSHEIKEGSFTTTIKVNLPAPGAEIDVTAPLGGAGGPQLQNTQ
jgi:hypothetical protein